jgi:hypothetical protein
MKNGTRVVYRGDHPMSSLILVGVGIVIDGEDEDAIVVDWINAPHVSTGIHEAANLAPALYLVR